MLSTSRKKTKIYVAQFTGNEVTTYDITTGAPTTPILKKGIASPEDVTIDAKDKIYVGGNNGTLTTYKSNGHKTKPTIGPLEVSIYGITVSPKGLIYVSEGTNVVTYTATGKQIKPTIAFLFPRGSALDGKGNIYVADSNAGTVTAFTPKGKPTGFAITDLNAPTDVAIDRNGKIYVVQKGAAVVTTYNADGTPATPTITGLSEPIGVAVASNGNIYVTDVGNGNVTTYNRKGKKINPTITGLSQPAGITVH